MFNSDIANIIKNAVHIHKTSYFESPYIEATEFGYRLTDNVASFVLDARDRMDKAFMRALAEQMELQKIGTAIIFDKDAVKKLVDRCEEKTVYIQHHDFIWGPMCPTCGAICDTEFNKEYCGNCGQKITWEAKKEGVKNEE